MAADAKQESLKAALKASTDAVEATDAAMYRLASGAIDVGLGAYGKGTDEGEQLARMRSKFHHGGADLPVAPSAVEPSE